jgi:apolipoprotein N-acyltransferase
MENMKNLCIICLVSVLILLWCLFHNNLVKTKGIEKYEGNSNFENTGMYVLYVPKREQYIKDVMKKMKLNPEFVQGPDKNKLDLLQHYNKVNLVPFGEFIPFKNIFGLIGFKTITNEYQSFSSGKIRKPLNIKNEKIELKLLPLICYEIIYSGKLSKDKNFDYIINISEDGWFGNSIGPKQHFSHSIFRSIESGKYIIRSSNNGISAIINPIGIVEQRVEFGAKGFVELSESKVIKPTLFMLYGNTIFLMLILLYIFLLFSFIKLRNE